MNLDGSHKIIGLSPLLIFSLLALCLRAIFFREIKVEGEIRTLAQLFALEHHKNKEEEN